MLKWSKNNQNVLMHLLLPMIERSTRLRISGIGFQDSPYILDMHFEQLIYNAYLEALRADSEIAKSVL